MTYILYGTNDFLIKEEINKIIKKNKIDTNSITNYNEDSLITDIIDDAYLMPLFSEYKLIIVTNLLNKLSKEDADKLLLYLDKENTNTILVFTENIDKLDIRKKVIKTIENKIECNKIVTNKFVKELFSGYQITDEVINKLINRVGEDLFNLQNEIEKLKTYKIDDKKILEEDLNITVKNIDDNIFTFIDYIINKNNEKIFEIYDVLLKKNTEPISIIVILANQIRLMYQVKELYKEGNTSDAIAGILEVHPYRVKLALEKGRNYSENILEDLLLKLANLDNDIKTGIIDADTGFEFFMLQM